MLQYKKDHRTFHDDLRVSELNAKKIIMERLGITVDHWNEDYRYDCVPSGGRIKKKYIGKKIEIKEDVESLRTGNLFIEYLSEHTGLPSGIQTTESDIYCIIRGDEMVVVETDVLKQMIANEEWRRIVEPKKESKKDEGDGNSGGYLIRVEKVKAKSIDVVKIPQ